mmetsp:Transcript_64426/g.194389  ORF Transcript_64426/g.194389 Transcript_64426/m.194389 type:complete len:205 (-) Transcript_64426:330-944(-)
MVSIRGRRDTWVRRLAPQLQPTVVPGQHFVHAPDLVVGLVVQGVFAVLISTPQVEWCVVVCQPGEVGGTMLLVEMHPLGVVACTEVAKVPDATFCLPLRGAPDAQLDGGATAAGHAEALAEVGMIVLLLGHHGPRLVLRLRGALKGAASTDGILAAIGKEPVLRVPRPDCLPRVLARCRLYPEASGCLQCTSLVAVSKLTLEGC